MPSRNEAIAMKPKSVRLAFATLMYSVVPWPMTRSLRESMRVSAHIHASTRAVENNQYDTALIPAFSWIARSTLPVPNHTSCAPKTTQTSTNRSLNHSRRA